MTNEDFRDKIALSVNEDGWLERLKANAAKVNGQYRPIYNRVFILPIKATEKTAGGIILTGDAHKANQPAMGYLINYGDTADKRAMNWLGNVVLYARRAGITHHTNALYNPTATGKGEVDYLICEDRDIVQHCLGFESIPVSELQIPHFEGGGYFGSSKELYDAYGDLYQEK